MYQSQIGFPRSSSSFFHQPLTERILISSRAKVRSIGFSAPSRLTVSVTSLPAGPVIESTALFSVQPKVLLPSTATMRSSLSTPAR